MLALFDTVVELVPGGGNRQRQAQVGLRCYPGATPLNSWNGLRHRKPLICLMAKGGVEPPTQGFSARSSKQALISNQALATHATFRERPWIT